MTLEVIENNVVALLKENDIYSHFTEDFIKERYYPDLPFYREYYFEDFLNDRRNRFDMVTFFDKKEYEKYCQFKQQPYSYYEMPKGYYWLANCLQLVTRDYKEDMPLIPTFFIYSFLMEADSIVQTSYDSILRDARKKIKDNQYEIPRSNQKHYMPIPQAISDLCWSINRGEAGLTDDVLLKMIYDTTENYCTKYAIVKTTCSEATREAFRKAQMAFSEDIGRVIQGKSPLFLPESEGDYTDGDRQF